MQVNFSCHGYSIQYVIHRNNLLWDPVGSFRDMKVAKITVCNKHLDIQVLEKSSIGNFNQVHYVVAYGTS